ncbi:hypothetical protein F5Y05DRAFT_380108 [Hypoxylon sp. FL0543]|nr:hypothetical protein F5Y05DRAFT_380108 [Hypoxylon sp. FL0543]
MDAASAREATKSRERGNELYKKGKLAEAARAYEKAASLDPSDPSPLSNLSAANFEAGKYSECVGFAAKALGLLKDDVGTAAVRQRLLIRQAKSYLHLSRLGEAEKLSDQLSPGKETEDLCSLLEGSREFTAFSPQVSTLREAILQLPRLRPSIQDEPDYFGPGHDDAESLYTPELEKSAGDDPVLSIMLCGCGDARHFFQTILRYSSTKRGTQKLCVTLLDHKPAVICRDLIFFSLLEEATIDEQTREITLLSLSYLYCTQVIPPFVWEKLQETINNLVRKLENKEQPLASAWVLVSQMDAIVQQLKTWQTGPATEYKAAQIRRIVSESASDEDAYRECKADRRAFRDFSVMFPPSAVLSRFEPELSALVTDYQHGDGRSRKRISAYLNKHWKVNPTLIDVKWQARQPPGDEPVLEGHPHGIVDKLIGMFSRLNAPNRASTYCILQHAGTFFEKVRLAILSLEDRLMVEMIIGDMTEVLDRLRYDKMERPKRGLDSEGRELLDWPQKYHIIHMSNIPDYVGGSLMTFLYAAPILKEGTGTGMMSIVLRNPRAWPSIDHINAEYLLMYDPVMIQDHFSVRLANGEVFKTSYPIPMSMSFLAILQIYQRWERYKHDRSSLEQLKPRAAFSRWLIAHFLKLCLPFPRSLVEDPSEEDDPGLVYAPFNMTVFLRLLVQMAELGYPGHWLSNIIASIGGGEITTTARAPRQYVLDPAAVDEVYTPRTISVKPWAAEFTTLVAQWQALLPFAVVVRSGILPLPEIITEYSVKFSWYPSRDPLNVPHFMLVFWNHRKYGEPPKDLYRLLLDDERGDTTTSARKIRADGIRILSTFKWSSEEAMVTFWLRSDVVDLMVREEWYVYIWRVDSWMRYSTGLPLKDRLFRKRTWTDCVASV